MSSGRKKDTIVRIVVHLLLAAFVANAANKFFVADLDAELGSGFYSRIFDFQGDAPDQYRILPLLPLKAIMKLSGLPFNHAVLIYNSIFGLICLELLWLIGGTLARNKKLWISVGFSAMYIYCQYTGWRPDTLGLLALCAGMLMGSRLPAGDAVKTLWFFIFSVALAFSRAEIALIYAIFIGMYHFKSWPLRISLALIPVIVQLLLKFYIFPDAKYYSEFVMIQDNFSLYYLLRNPMTYLVIAVLIGFYQPVKNFITSTFHQYLYLYLLFAGFFLLVLVIGRINEYRLYLPFLPLFLAVLEQYSSPDE